MVTTHDVLKWLLIMSLPIVGAVSLHPLHAETLSELIKTPAAYNGTSVSLHGVAGQAEQKWSSEGNPYTVFSLTDASGQMLTVYKGGHVHSISAGRKVIVTGNFFGAFADDGLKAANVIDAKSIDEE